MIYNLFFNSLSLLFENIALENWQFLTIQILSTTFTIALYLIFLIVPIFAIKLITSIFSEKEEDGFKRKKRRR